MTTECGRRALLKAGAAIATGSVAVGLSGCIMPPPQPEGGAGGGAPIRGGGSMTRQALTEEDTHDTATTTDEFLDHANASDGRKVWLPPGNTYDLSGQDLSLSNVTFASGRSDDATGAVITTSDEGANSHAWNAGEGKGLITCEDNVRLTGLAIKGPHTDVTDHPVISGYFPFAPGGEAARERWRRARFARGVSIYGDNVMIDNCDIWGFSVQGVSVGSSNTVPQNVEINYCSVTNCMMTSYGYAIDIRHGHPKIYRCYFDATRHSICGSGMGDSGYSLIECTFGPWTASHQIDQHRVGENTSGSSNPDDVNYQYRAGNMMYVKDCVIMPNRVPDLPVINHNRGGQTPHAHIRGVPLDGFYIEGTTMSHPSPKSGIKQSGFGPHDPNDNGYLNINIDGSNTWGQEFERMQNVP